MSKTNKGLGMGLDALFKVNIQEAEADAEKAANGENVIAGFVEIPIEKIAPNPNQPRKNFDQESLENLSVSIKNFGLIQPITVMKKGDIYEIIAGERRYRASIIAGLKKIPVIIKDLSQKEKMEISLVENIQRENLNPVEEALAYSSLIDSYNITQEELSLRLGKSRTAITNTIRLLNLDPQIQKWIIESKITPGHARTILSLDTKKEHINFANYIIEKNLSVRESEQLAKKWPLETAGKKQKTKSVREVEIQDIEKKIASKYQAKVNIIGTTVKGRIQIEYYTQEELEGLMDKFGIKF
jgi:ParB family transcriptional regulator, chromosome partitioning protein